MDTCKNKIMAFTLIELLVVVSIISLLLSILVPALGRARSSARAIKSLSNMRQWGLGATMWSMEHDDMLPWEGNKNDYMYANFSSDKWWANAIPPMLDGPGYRQLSETAIEQGTYVPLPSSDTDSIFIDPAAEFPYSQEAICLYDGKNSYEYQLFFCYIWNSELNNGPTASILDDVEQVRMSNISRTSETVLMLEMRTTNEELAEDDYEYYRKCALLGRHRGDWKRIARRHMDGGHIVFCDGHAERVDYNQATTNIQGSRDPDFPDGDWNKGGLIWNAFGPSLK